MVLFSAIKKNDTKFFYKWKEKGKKKKIWKVINKERENKL